MKARMQITMAAALSLCLLFLCDIAIGAKEEADPSQVVLAKIGDTKITLQDLNDRIEAIPFYVRSRFLTVEGKKELLTNMIRGELLYQAALEAGYDELPEVKSKYQETAKGIIQTEYFYRELSDLPMLPDDELRAYYEKHKGQFRTVKSVNIYHILCNNLADAQRVRKMLKKDGSNFKQIARKESVDASSIEGGGYLGNYRVDRNTGLYIDDPEFKSTIFELKEGEISQPIKTRYGYHIIYASKVFDSKLKPFEIVKDDINNRLLVTEEDIRNEYEKNKEAYMTKPKVRAARILVDDKRTAEKVMKKLREGASFGELAKKYSKDEKTAQLGGDIGFVYPGAYIKDIGRDEEIEQAILSLSVGEFTDPIETNAGYFIFTVTQKEEPRLRPLHEIHSQVKESLLYRLKENYYNRVFEDWKEKYRVTYFTENILDTSDEFVEEELPMYPPDEEVKLPELPFLKYLK